jgi:hypothetical protein
MKFMDWAAMGMASGAYGAASSAYEEAIRARLTVDGLWKEHQRLRDELEFQKWVEELIYQFNKTVTAISEAPGNPIVDYCTTSINPSLTIEDIIHLKPD